MAELGGAFSDNVVVIEVEQIKESDDEDNNNNNNNGNDDGDDGDEEEVEEIDIDNYFEVVNPVTQQSSRLSILNILTH